MPGNEVVIEELLIGSEISVLAFSDGYTILPLPAAQDHKRIGEGDSGLNTGGMGAYAPAPVATPAIMQRIMRETIRPTIDGMRKQGKVSPYVIEDPSTAPFYRLSLRRHALYRIHADRLRPESFGVQCSLWRSRNASAHALARI